MSSNPFQSASDVVDPYIRRRRALDPPIMPSDLTPPSVSMAPLPPSPRQVRRVQPDVPALGRPNSPYQQKPTADAPTIGREPGQASRVKPLGNVSMSPLDAFGNSGATPKGDNTRVGGGKPSWDDSPRSEKAAIDIPGFGKVSGVGITRTPGESYQEQQEAKISKSKDVRHAAGQVQKQEAMARSRQSGEKLSEVANPIPIVSPTLGPDFTKIKDTIGNTINAAQKIHEALPETGFPSPRELGYVGTGINKALGENLPFPSEKAIENPKGFTSPREAFAQGVGEQLPATASFMATGMLPGAGPLANVAKGVLGGAVPRVIAGQSSEELAKGAISDIAMFGAGPLAGGSFGRKVGAGLLAGAAAHKALNGDIIEDAKPGETPQEQFDRYMRNVGTVSNIGVGAVMGAHGENTPTREHIAATNDQIPAVPLETHTEAPPVYPTHTGKAPDYTSTNTITDPALLHIPHGDLGEDIFTPHGKSLTPEQAFAPTTNLDIYSQQPPGHLGEGGESNPFFKERPTGKLSLEQQVADQRGIDRGEQSNRIARMLQMAEANSGGLPGRTQPINADDAFGIPQSPMMQGNQAVRLPDGSEVHTSGYQDTVPFVAGTAGQPIPRGKLESQRNKALRIMSDNPQPPIVLPSPEDSSYAQAMYQAGIPDRPPIQPAPPPRVRPASSGGTGTDSAVLPPVVASNNPVSANTGTQSAELPPLPDIVRPGNENVTDVLPPPQPVVKPSVVEAIHATPGGTVTIHGFGKNKGAVEAEEYNVEGMLNGMVELRDSTYTKRFHVPEALISRVIDKDGKIVLDFTKQAKPPKAVDTPAPITPSKAFGPNEPPIPRQVGDPNAPVAKMPPYSDTVATKPLPEKPSVPWSMDTPRPTERMPQVQDAGGKTPIEQTLARIQGQKDGGAATIQAMKDSGIGMFELRKLVETRDALTPEDLAALPAGLGDIISQVPDLSKASQPDVISKLGDFPGPQQTYLDSLAALGGKPEPPIGPVNSEGNLLRKNAVYDANRPPSGTTARDAKAAFQRSRGPREMSDNRATVAKHVASKYATPQEFVDAVSQGLLDPETARQVESLHEQMRGIGEGTTSQVRGATINKDGTMGGNLAKLWAEGRRALAADPNYKPTTTRELPLKSVPRITSRLPNADRATTPEQQGAVDRTGVNYERQGTMKPEDVFAPDNKPLPPDTPADIEKGDSAAAFFENLDKSTTPAAPTKTAEGYTDLRPGSAERPEASMRPGAIITDVDPRQLEADPERLQFKGLTNDKGVTTALSGVDTWNERLGGTVAVWSDPETGKVHPVNGHHRHELAMRAINDGQKVNGFNVSFIDADTAAQAKIQGGLLNMGENSASMSATDVAGVLRESGHTPAELKKMGIAIDAPKVSDGIALSKIDPMLYDLTRKRAIPENQAVQIAREFPDSHSDQVELYKSFEGRRVSADMISEIAAHMKASPTVEETQTDLFGSYSKKERLHYEMGSLADTVKQRLGSDKRFFGKLGDEKAASKAGEAGNVLNVEENRKRAESSGEALGVFDRLKAVNGPINEALQQGAIDLKKGGNSEAVRNEVYSKVRQAIEQEIGNTFNRPTAGAERTERGGGTAKQPETQGGLFGGGDEPTGGAKYRAKIDAISKEITGVRDELKKAWKNVGKSTFGSGFGALQDLGTAGKLAIKFGLLNAQNIWYKAALRGSAHYDAWRKSMLETTSPDMEPHLDDLYTESMKEAGFDMGKQPSRQDSLLKKNPPRYSTAELNKISFEPTTPEKAFSSNNEAIKAREQTEFDRREAEQEASIGKKRDFFKGGTGELRADLKRQAASAFEPVNTSNKQIEEGKRAAFDVEEAKAERKVAKRKEVEAQPFPLNAELPKTPVGKQEDLLSGGEHFGGSPKLNLPDGAKIKPEAAGVIQTISKALNALYLVKPSAAGLAIGTTAHVFAKNLIGRPLAAAADMALGKFSHVDPITGEKVAAQRAESTPSIGEVGTAIKQGAKGIIGSGKEALPKDTKGDYSLIGEHEFYAGENPAMKGIAKAINAVGGARQAFHAPSVRAALDFTLNNKINVDKINATAQGQEFDAGRVKKLIQDRFAGKLDDAGKTGAALDQVRADRAEADARIKEAWPLANHDALLAPSKTYKRLTDLRSELYKGNAGEQLAALGLDRVLPFVKIAHNVWKQGYSDSLVKPVKALKAVTDSIGRRGITQDDHVKIVDAVKQLGPAVITGLIAGGSLYSAGKYTPLINFNPLNDESKAERELNRARNVDSGSVSVGGQSVPLHDVLGPLATPFDFGANIAKAIESKKNGGTWQGLATDMGKYLLAEAGQHPFAKAGTETLYDWKGPEGSVGRAVSNQISGVVPPVVTQTKPLVNALTGKGPAYERRGRDPGKDFAGGTWDALKNKTFDDQSLPTHPTALGDNNAMPMFGAVNPFNSKTERFGPAIDVARSTGAGLNMQKKQPGESQDDYSRRITAGGKNVNRSLAALKDNKGFQKLPRAEQVDAVKETEKQAHVSDEDGFFEMINPWDTLDALTERKYEAADKAMEQKARGKIQYRLEGANR